MNDLDTLRAALRAPASDPGTVDLDTIMAAGRRMRRRRRLLGAGAVAGITAAAVLFAGAWTVRQPDPDLPGVAVTVGRTAPVTGNPPVGAVIQAGGDRVFYFVAVDQPLLPKTHIGVVAGRQDPAGGITAGVMTNEFRGADRSPGFHALSLAMGIDSGPVPAFGYFVGPAAQIIAVAGGRRVLAHQAQWSEDPRVVVFWFDLADLPIGTQPSALVALDRAGNRL
jgi:hypothetical protein